MNSRANSDRRIRTGLFEIDLSSGQVLKKGQRMPLQEQPFRVLAMLLEKPGQVVTRDELRSRLWAADTYVGFDEGVNTAVRKLRVLFGDSADNPRFIETIPRRGYRFIAPVTLEIEENTSQIPKQEVNSKNGPFDLTRQAIDGNREEKGYDGRVPDIVLKSSKVRLWTVAILLAAILSLVSAVVMRRRQVGSSQNNNPARRAMLAVLPFQNLTKDPSQEYFADGMTEETITDLGQLSPTQLGVIARTSAMAYKRTNKTASQIGRELAVDYILEGSVRRENARVRVSAQLIRVSDQTHLWAQNYDARNLSDLIDVQNEIGRAIAEQVQASVSPMRQLELSRLHPVSPDAYDLYLKGRFYWNQRTPASVLESIELFKKAIAADPNFAQAYAGLADAYNISSIVGALSSIDSLPKAKVAATKAIELDPSLAEAHAALGMEKSHYEFDFPGAKTEFLKAIDLNPNSAYAHLFFSNCYLMPLGLKAEAIEENKKAMGLDPLSLPINNFMGETYLLAGDYVSSVKQFRQTIEMDPNFPLSHAYLAGLLEVTQKFEEAVSEREKGDRLSGLSPTRAADRADKLLRAFKTGGETGFWKANLAQDFEAVKASGGDSQSSQLAEDFALAGEKDKAFEYLEKAYRGREGEELTLLAVDPAWKNLHGDPRFINLLQRIGLRELGN